MPECFIAGEQIHQLHRDLRILIATNGTLTRILGVVADEDIIVQIIDQRVLRHTDAVEPLPSGRTLQRRVLLKGRDSGSVFVAAESMIAVDLLPDAIAASLTSTELPIGEIMAAGCLETFKEPAEVWLGEPPDWLATIGFQPPSHRIVGRRYRIIMGTRPVMTVTEHFLHCGQETTS